MGQRKAVLVQYLLTDEHIVDVLTKLVAKLNFEYFHDELGLIENVLLDERDF
jgi:hypothetical protein